MPNYTSNYNLSKPLGSELYDIEVQNANMDAIDVNLKSVSEVASSANERSTDNVERLESLENFEKKPFTETGKAVQFEVYQDSPLYVTSKIECVQSGTGTPSTDNIRPIIGTNDVNLVVCGKNLFSATWEQGNIDAASGEDVADDTAVRCGYIAVAPNTTYAISRDITTSFVKLRAYDRYKNYIGYGQGVVTMIEGSTTDNPIGVGSTKCILTTKENVHYLRFVDMSNDLNTKYQVEANTSVSEYEAFTGKTFACSIGQTVYGGTLDWDTGKLTVTHVGVNLSELTDWRASDNQAGRFVINLEQVVGSLPICDVLPCKNNYTEDDASVQWTIFNNHGEQLVINTNLLTLDDWKTWMTQNSPFIVYQPKEPVVIETTKNNVFAVDGLNNVFSDAVETTVNARHDILSLTHKLVENIGGGSSSGGGSSVVVPSGGGSYAVEEHLTGETWIDGKPIYRQIMTATVVAKSQVKIGSAPNAETYVRIDGTLKYTASATDIRWFPMSYVSASSVFNRVNTTSNDMYVYTAYAGTVYIIAEYTKTE